MDYFDELLYHEVMTIYYANEFSSEISEGFESTMNQIREIFAGEQSIATKYQARELLLYIKDILEAYKDEITERFILESKLISDKESKWYSEFLKTQTGKDIKVPEKLNSLIYLMPFTVNESAKSFVNNFLTSIKNNINNVINAGLFMSYSSDQMVENFNKMSEVMNKKLELDSQTMIKSFVDNTQNQIKKSNSKIFTGYKWCSVLDSRTCDVCADLNGSVYNTISDAPFSPIHYRCRCSTVGFFNENVEPEWNTFGEWIKELPEDKQIDILGKKRFELWKSGELEIKDFVNDGKKILLEDLYKN